MCLEDSRFDTQQAAKKAIRGLLPSCGMDHPFIHGLAALSSLVEESGTDVPSGVFDAAILTRYSVVGGYPGPVRPVPVEDGREAGELADRGVR